MTEQQADRLRRLFRAGSFLLIVIALAWFATKFWRRPAGIVRPADLGIPEVAPDTLEPRVATAVQQATAELLVEPKSADRWGRLGCIFQVHNQLDEAGRCYERARELDPMDFRWPYFRALTLVELGDPDAATTLADAVELRPDYAPAYIRLGEALLEQDKRVDAKAAFQHALSLDADNLHAHLGLARLADLAGDPQTALTHLKVCAARAPKATDVQSLLARTYRRLEDPDAARLAAERAVDGSPADRDDPVMHEVLAHGVSAYWSIVRGNQALSAGDAAAAERHYRDAIDSRPDVGKHRYSLGNLLERQGRVDEAIEAYEGAVSRDQSLAAAHARLAGLFAVRGDTARATQHLQAMLASDPERQADRRRIVLLLVAAGACDEAEPWLTASREDDPTDVGLMSAWAICLSARGQADEAIAILQAVVDERKGRVEPLLNLARVAITHDRLDLATRTLDRANGLPTTEATAVRLEQLRAEIARRQGEAVPPPGG